MRIIRDRARLSPDEFLRTLPQPAILDEIQYAPELLRHLKLAVDRDRRPGRFLVTGSQTLSLMAGVSEVCKRLLATGHPPPIWFWRTAHGEELDRLIEIGPERAGRSHLLSCAREPSMIAKHPVPPAALARLESLGDALAGCPQVLFAYLFGSAASGDLRPLGDVDVAVFLAPSVDRMEGRLVAIDVTTSHLGTDEVDVVVLNEAPTALAGRILATRRVITDRDPFQRQAFESLVMRQYADFRILEHRVLSGRYPRG